jgi:hypothetical protein
MRFAQCGDSYWVDIASLRRREPSMRQATTDPARHGPIRCPESDFCGALFGLIALQYKQAG